MNLQDVEVIAVQSMFDKVDEVGGLYPPSRYYAFFARLATVMKPRLSVVLGVCGGGDCYHLAKAHPEGRVIGVDITYDHPEQVGHIEKNFPNFTFMLSESVAAAKPIYDQFGPIDLLFVDTDHTLGLTEAELRAYRPYLTQGAVVCLDDLFRPGMEEAWDQISEPKVRMDFLHDGSYPHGGGFGVYVNPEASLLLRYNPGYELGC